MITELEFKSLMQQGYNRIPLMLEAFADLETPLSLYLKLAHHKDGGKYSFLLESVVGGERFGRYSFIGLPARTLLQARGFGDEARTEVVTDGVVVESAAGNPLDFIEQYQQRFKVALRPGLPRFCGGLAGYFGYDAVRYIEKKLEKTCPPDSLGTPDILLLQCEELAVIDNLSGKLYLIVYADPGMPEAYAKAKKRLRELKEQLKYSVSAPVVSSTQTYPAERDFKKEDYLKAVLEAKELIAGYTLIQVRSREEALEWSRRFPNPVAEGADCEVEVRQLYEMEDFGEVAQPATLERFRDLGVVNARLLQVGARHGNQLRLDFQ